jgi:hypothetical protein
VIARWKGIVEEINFGGSIIPLDIIENLDLEKPSFGPSKWPRKLKPAKNSKLPKLPESRFEPFGKGGWPLISTWINFCENENNFIPPELAETNSDFCQRTPCRQFHCTPCRKTLAQTEKQLKLIPYSPSLQISDI